MDGPQDNISAAEDFAAGTSVETLEANHLARQDERDASSAYDLPPPSRILTPIRLMPGTRTILASILHFQSYRCKTH